MFHFNVDFFCHELILAIEIDGNSHDMKSIEDSERQDFLESKGNRFLRFTDKKIKTQIHFVLQSIENRIRMNNFGT